MGPGTPNTAPTAAHKTVTTGEDRAYAFTADDFGFNDDDAGDTLASVKIVTVPLLGTLALDGTAVLADAVVTEAQIDADMLTFTPARDAHGDPYTTFTFTVNDGTDDSASAYTMTIDVTDAPAPVCVAPSFGDRREIWTGTVTVERGENAGFVYYGFNEGVAGTLLPSQSFSIGSNNYAIDAILVTFSGTLEFSLGGFDSYLTDREVTALRLNVCDGDYDFNTFGVNTTTWLRTTLDWSPPVVTRTVYLSLPANNVATGEPAITGTAVAGQELTATAGTIMDTDGVPSSFTYQWLRVDADGTSNPADITDATAATYTLTAADAGKKIKVQVSFTDELSGEEERTSAAYPSSGTVTTIASTTAPALLSVTVTSTPHKTTDTYGAREHIEFSMTFDAAVTVTGDPTFAFDLGGPSTATWYAGSGTATLRFSHAVTGGTSGDRDTNGISWAAERDRAQRRHHRGDRQRGGGGPDPRRPVEPGGAQGRRPDDARHARHGDGRGGDLDADVDGVGLVHGGHLRFRRDDRDHGHRQRGGGGGGRSRVPILADQPRQCRQQPAGRLRSHAQHRDDDGIRLHGAGGRHGQQRHLDRHPQPNLPAGRERPHPHGLAADRHRPQPSREGHAGRPQGGRIPGGADRTAGSHGADPGVGHRHDAHHRVDAPG